MKEKYKIEVESQGDYDAKKEVNFVVNMTSDEFLELVSAILEHLKTKKIENYQKPPVAAHL